MRDGRVDGGLDELAPAAPSRERLGDLGVDQHEAAASTAIVEMGQFALGP